MFTRHEIHRGIIMRVNSIDIREFRGIKECQGPIPLTKFTVLVGRNNSGKSAVLEALSLLPHPAGEVPIAQGQNRLGFIRNLHSGKPLIYGYDGTAKIIFNLNEPRIKPFANTKEWNVNIEKKEERDIVSLSLEEGATIDSRHLAGRMGIESDALKNMVVFIPNNTEILKKLDALLISLKDRIMKAGAHVNVARYMSECVNDKFTEILMESSALSLRKELPDGNVFYIQLADLGDGIKKVIRIMLLLEVLNPDIVLMDDFEASAHPGLVGVLLKWLAGKDWQVVLSTHSIDVLYQLLDVDPEGLSVVLLNKTEGDILLHDVMSYDILEAQMDANQDPRLLVDALGLG